MPFVFPFSAGNKSQKKILGGKGANLAEMTNLGIPVPYGFTISTESCIEFYAQDQRLWDDLVAEIEKNIQYLEEQSGKTFGAGDDPHLVSVRSGAAISMPGMMVTILNLGLNFEMVEYLARRSQYDRFAWDSFRRFIQMYGNVVLEIDHHDFEEEITRLKTKEGITDDTEVSAEQWKKVVQSFFQIIKQKSGQEFPLNAKDQLLGAVSAVFKSWNADRAIYYRDINGIDHNMGTAVNIQMMVFGNQGETSGTGVCFTRDPSSGENAFYGEFLMNAQGEDVVAGIRTPKPISEMEQELPEVYAELCVLRERLEEHFGDMQDIEFTIEDKKLFILQTRSGKRSAMSSVRIAVEMIDEGKITPEEALVRVSDEDIETLLHPKLDDAEKKKKTPICIGLPASPGGATGKIVFTAEDALHASKHEEKVILVRHETSPEDITGMHCSEGVLTACGGMTSHAAVVARGMGRPCVSGASDIRIDESRGVLRIDDLVLKKGDVITLDGSTGEVFSGKIEKIPPQIDGPFLRILEIAQQKKSLQVRTNADTPKDAKRAVEFGAEGIGLCRTEHMFFEKKRILEVRKMILSEDILTQEKALKEIELFQTQDFTEIYEALEDRPICIRLLDPPLHEFLPQSDYEIEELSEVMEKSPQYIRERIEHLHEVNPMMGHRGCRLLITQPSLLETQVRSILSAGEAIKKKNIEIMIPLVSSVNEFCTLKKRIQAVAKNYSVQPLIGTMIETPRACLVSQEIAKHADFFSFGTNDLTQMTFGFSRDDMGKFLPEYLKNDILDHDPFQEIDQEGVGRLMTDVVNALPEGFKTSVCGEHGGNGASIQFFDTLGIKTVSCSPFRVPVALVASGRAKCISQ